MGDEGQTLSLPAEGIEPSGADLVGQSTMDQTAQWQLAVDTLRELLARHNGIVSSRALRPILEERGVLDARAMCVRLKLFNFDDPEPELPPPGFRYCHRGRSFYSETQFKEAEAQTDAAADEQADQESAGFEYSEHTEETVVRRKYKQEEARLCKYVEAALETIYASEYGPDVQVAYDIHNERPGSEFENMDVIAIHWRSDKVVELVGVEVKLDFSPRLVLQASNYKRFAHRVWAAVPVSSDEPGVELRERDPLLFEHVLEEGIGIMACRKKQGGAYDVWPIHWPQLNRLDSIARDAFIDRYRTCFETACVVEPQHETWRPKLR